MKKLFSVLLMPLLAAVMSPAAPTLLASAADFSGETIEWMIPFKEGGGSDKWSRFYAPLLSQALPGQPDVVVKNVPGGGSTTGANQFAARAKPDGLTIFGTSGSTQFPFLLGDKRVQYDYADWTIVLGTPTGGVVYVAADMGVSSPADFAKLKAQDLKYGSQGATSLDLVPLLAFDLMGLDVKAVFGMKGRSAGRLAFERGETSIDYQTTSAYLKNVQPLVDEGKATPLFSWGSIDANGNLARDPTFPNLPHFAEFYEAALGSAPSGEAFDAWKTFFAAGFPAQKMVFLPKGTSDDIIKTYRDAFAAVVSAPGFAESSAKRLGVYKQAVHNDAEALYKVATSVDPKARDWVRNWLTEKYGTQF